MERQAYIRLVAECREMLRQQVALDDAIGQANPDHYCTHRAQLDALTAELHDLTHQARVILWPAHGHEDEIWWLADTIDRAYDHRYAVGVAQGRTDRLYQVHLVAPVGALDPCAVAGEAKCHGYDLTAYRGLIEQVA